ncbi:hypothetical protein CDD81_5137 [Ophiocordyceps australis]|uniref:ER membrane protein complex subunit 7 beta-sandwich domain-containing protein n=1 Tax=Ophiocordyceps australis TaxID=1399860 RepID=A0A2C5Y9V7_9HYPO|nr:hypothetical protein CDD81_5137 [Ophiocordyceps australis]
MHLLMLLLMPLALCTIVKLHLPATPSPISLSSRTHATLSTLGTYLSAPLSAHNTIVFRNVTSGSYLVDVHCPSEAYRPLRVDVAQDGSVTAWDTFRGNEWENLGEVVPVKNGALEVRWMGSRQYYLERPGFSVLGILKNPMILMGLVSMLIFIGMPYLMENMDPEMKAEFEAQQRKGGPMAAMMGGNAQAGNPLGDFDMAAFLAGSKKKEVAAPQTGEAASAPREQGVRR